jgi:hypothetical protein
MPRPDNNDAFAAHEDLGYGFLPPSHHCQQHFFLVGGLAQPLAHKMVIAPKHWYLTADSYYPNLPPSAWMLVDVARLPNTENQGEAKINPSGRGAWQWNI